MHSWLSKGEVHTDPVNQKWKIPQRTEANETVSALLSANTSMDSLGQAHSAEQHGDPSVLWSNKEVAGDT